jgi:hypothetical protein
MSLNPVASYPAPRDVPFVAFCDGVPYGLLHGLPYVALAIWTPSKLMAAGGHFLDPRTGASLEPYAWMQVPGWDPKALEESP